MIWFLCFSDTFFPENIPETVANSNAPAPGSLQSDGAKIQIDFLLTISPCFDFQIYKIS